VDAMLVLALVARPIAVALLSWRKVVEHGAHALPVILKSGMTLSRGKCPELAKGIHLAILSDHHGQVKSITMNGQVVGGGTR
jgi:hypothetical protein